MASLAVAALAVPWLSREFLSAPITRACSWAAILGAIVGGMVCYVIHGRRRAAERARIGLCAAGLAGAGVWALFGNMHCQDERGVLRLSADDFVYSETSSVVSEESATPPAARAHGVATWRQRLSAQPFLPSQTPPASEVCCICLEGLSTGTATELPGNVCEVECGHFFHVGCLSRWLERGDQRCPLCKHAVSAA